MFCRECGDAVPERAKFCPSCGTSCGASAEATRIPDAAPGVEPVVIRPVHVPTLTFLQLLPISLFMTLWGGGFFGGFSMAAIQALDLPIPAWLPFVGFGSLFLLGLPIVVMRTSRRTSEETEYRFFPHKLEYFEGFFNVQQKSIALEDVTEVHLTKGVFQSRYGLGTVVLSTRASAGNGRFSGVRIANVENPDQVYGNVMELVERARHGERSLRRVA